MSERDVHTVAIGARGAQGVDGVDGRAVGDLALEGLALEDGAADGRALDGRALDLDTLDIDVLPVIGDVGEVADGIRDLPEDILRRWRLAGGIQVRTLVTARTRGVLVGAAFEVHRPLTAYRKIVDVWAPDERVADILVDTIEERAWREGAVAVKRWFAAKDSAGRENDGFAGDDVPGFVAGVSVDMAGVSVDVAGGPVDGPGADDDRAGDGRGHGGGADAGRNDASADAGGTTAWRRSLERGYQEMPVPVWAAPVTSDPADTGYGQVRWRGAAPDRALPYMRQTTDFTCGPVALQLALCGLGLQDQPDRAEEMRMWRQATTVAGCDPLGLALAAADRGAVPEVLLSTERPILLELCRTDEERDLRRFIQSGFRADLADRGIAVETAAFDLDRLRAVLADGSIALVLIEQFGMHAEPSPHWITVHSVDGDIFYANDPWTDADLGETYLDALDLPLPAPTLDRLAWYGAPSYRSMVVLRAA